MLTNIANTLNRELHRITIRVITLFCHQSELKTPGTPAQSVLFENMQQKEV